MATIVAARRAAFAGRRIAEAKKSGKLPAGAEIDPSNPYAIAEFYAQRFLEDARHLGLKVAIEERTSPELMPRPTRCVPQMVALVEQLVASRITAGDATLWGPAAEAEASLRLGWTQAVAISRRLWLGISVAMPTAMPLAPLSSENGSRAGSCFGSWVLPS